MTDGTPTSCEPSRSRRILFPQAEGSVLIEIGKTRVICTATVDDGVP